MIVKSTRKERAVLIENSVIRRDSLLVHTCGLSVRREDLKLVQSCKFSMRTALGAVSFLLKLVVFQLESFKLIRKANKSKVLIQNYQISGYSARTCGALSDWLELHWQTAGIAEEILHQRHALASLALLKYPNSNCMCNIMLHTHCIIQFVWALAA